MLLIQFTMIRQKNQEKDRPKADPFQTVDKPSPMRQRLDPHGGIVKGGGYAPLHVQSMPKWELFRKFPFWRFKLSTLCRQLERTFRTRKVLFASFIRLSDKKKTKICEMDLCQARHRPQGILCVLPRAITKHAANPAAKIVWFLY